VIFTTLECRQILDGRKTQARRPAKPAVREGMPIAEALRHTSLRVGAAVPLERPALRSEVTPDDVLAGRRIAITIAHVEITALRVERLGAISPRDLRAEGCKTTPEFAARWLYSHGDARWLAEDREDVAIVERFMPHIARLVWVVALHPTDAPRMLAARVGRGDYTDDPRLAMRGEGEAIPAAAQEAMSKAARERDIAARAGAEQEALATMRRAAERLRATVGPRRTTNRELRRIGRALDVLADDLTGDPPC
jgi:hypothetical protein